MAGVQSLYMYVQLIIISPVPIRKYIVRIHSVSPDKTFSL